MTAKYYQRKIPEKKFVKDIKIYLRKKTEGEKTLGKDQNLSEEEKEKQASILS